MNKWFTMLGALLLSLALAVPAFAAQAPITVYVDGVRLSFSAGSPYLQNGSVMVPFRAVFEKLGLKVGWDPVARSVTGTSTNLNLRLTIGSNRASVNSTVRKLPAAPYKPEELPMCRCALSAKPPAGKSCGTRPQEASKLLRLYPKPG